jgi:hypothetical protein
LEDVGVGGYYDFINDEIVVYIPSPENEPALRKHLMNTEAPDDLRARVKHFFSYNHFGWLAATILHESIHQNQRPSNIEILKYDQRKLRHFDIHGKELREMQAFSEMARAHMTFGLRKRISDFREDRDKSGMTDQQREFFEGMKTATAEQRKAVFKQMAASMGVSPEDMAAAMEVQLKQYERGGFDIPQAYLQSSQYNFNTDRLIVATHVIDQLRALRFSEKEIARLIGEYGGDWNAEKARYDSLEDFIEGEAGKRDLDSDDIETLIMGHNIRQRIEYNKVVERKLVLAKQLLEESG